MPRLRRPERTVRPKPQSPARPRVRDSCPDGPSWACRPGAQLRSNAERLCCGPIPLLHAEPTPRLRSLKRPCCAGFTAWSLRRLQACPGQASASAPRTLRRNPKSDCATALADAGATTRPHQTAERTRPFRAPAIGRSTRQTSTRAGRPLPADSAFRMARISSVPSTLPPICSLRHHPRNARRARSSSLRARRRFVVPSFATPSLPPAS